MQGPTQQARVARLESRPRSRSGEASARIVLSNAGDPLHIAKPNAAVSAR